GRSRRAFNPRQVISNLKRAVTVAVVATFVTASLGLADNSRTLERVGRSGRTRRRGRRDRCSCQRCRLAARGPMADTDEAAFDGLIHINVKAPFFLVAALAPKIAARGGGAIINVS